MSCHVARHVISCRFMSCHVMSCQVMSCHVVSCPVCHSVSHHVVSSNVMSCRAVSCHVMSCHVMSCRVASLVIISCSRPLTSRRISRYVMSHVISHHITRYCNAMAVLYRPSPGYENMVEIHMNLLLNPNPECMTMFSEWTILRRAAPCILKLQHWLQATRSRFALTHSRPPGEIRPPHNRKPKP